MPYYVLYTAVLLLGFFLLGAWLACATRRLFWGVPIAARAPAVATAAVGAGAAAASLASERTTQSEASIFGARETTVATEEFDSAARMDDPVDAVEPVETPIEPTPASDEITAGPADLVDVLAPPPEPAPHVDNEQLDHTADAEPDADSVFANFPGTAAAAASPVVASDAAATSTLSETVEDILPSPDADEPERVSLGDTTASTGRQEEENPTTNSVEADDPEIDEPTGDPAGQQVQMTPDEFAGREASVVDAVATTALGAGLTAAGLASASAADDQVPQPVEATHEEVQEDTEPTRGSEAVSQVATSDEVTPEHDVKPQSALHAASGPADNLQRIRGIDSETEAHLNEAGISRYDQLAALTSADVSALHETIGTPARISREGWIEQASILAAGGETYFSVRQERQQSGSIATPATPTPVADSQPPTETQTLSDAETEHVVANDAPDTTGNAKVIPAVAAALATGGAASLVAEASESDASDAIDGTSLMTDIEAGEEATAGHVEESTPVLDQPDRSADHAESVEYGEPDATVPEQDAEMQVETGVVGEPVVVETLTTPVAEISPESVAEVVPGPVEPPTAEDPIEAVATPEGSEVTAPSMLPPRPGRVIGAGGGRRVQSSDADDLKRIRGVGVVIEKKLNAMGITSYSQIAQWSGDDIEKVNGILDFSGRIERENWIEQARVLSGTA